MTRNKDKKIKALKTIRKQEQEALERRRKGNNPEIKQLGEALDRLKVQYEKYFLGIDKLEPTAARKKFINKMQRGKQLAFKTPEDKFKINNIYQRFQTLVSYWDRVLREKENGTYKRDLFKAALENNTSVRRKAPNDALVARELYDSFRDKIDYKDCLLYTSDAADE